MPTKTIWRQQDRETPTEQARRTHLTALTLVTGMIDSYDGQLERLAYRDAAVFYQRILGDLSTALYRTRILLEAYDYYLVRCAEAGMTPEQAHAAWQIHGSPAFEEEMVEAESYGPNAMRMIDEQILAPLGIPPDDAEGLDEEEQAPDA